MNAIFILFLGLMGPASAELNPEAKKYLDDGVSQLYNLDYTASRESFRKIITLAPEHPAGYLFESGGIWWQSSAEYGLFKGTPTLQGLFEKDVRLAVKKSEAMLKAKNPATLAEAHFSLGMALGTRGQWALMRGNWIKACFDGRRAAKHLRECVKLDPDYADAYLGLGVYDYQAANLPKLMKFSAALCGAHGDEQKGLAQMRLAMAKGRYGARQAEQFLLSIYILDKHDYARALTLAQSLRLHFPQSPYFHFIEVTLRQRLGDRDGSLKEGRELFGQVRANPRGFNHKWLSLICGLTGDKCLSPKELKLARSWFQYAIDSETAAPKPEGLYATGVNVPSAEDIGELPEDSPDWLSFTHLFNGYAADALGERPAAVTEYEWVAAHPAFDDAHARAAACLKTPCTRRVLLEYLRGLSSGRLEIAKSER